MDAYQKYMHEQARYKWLHSQARSFDSAMRQLGKNSSIQNREYHGIMRIINGGQPLRGFARDQRYSEDPDVSAKSEEALRVADDAETNQRLVVDEEGNVHNAQGNVVVENDDGDPAVEAMSRLQSHFEKFAADIAGVKDDLAYLTRSRRKKNVVPDSLELAA